MRLAGKTALVVGGGSGIGREIASAFASCGAQVVVADLSGAAAHETAWAVRSRGVSALGVEMDVRSDKSINSAVDAMARQFGPPDVLFNGAGIFEASPMGQMSRRHLAKTLDVNVCGTAMVMQAVALVMLDVQRRGKIINVASVAGRIGSAISPAYAASKAAVISLTQGAALAWASQGINVNAIAPGPIVTPMWQEVQRNAATRGLDAAAFDEMASTRLPIGRLGAPADLVGAAIFLASDESDFMVGQTLNVDGGGFLN